MGELTLETVLGLLAGDARILMDADGYITGYNLVTRHGSVGGIWDELCRGGWIESMANGGTFKLSDAGLKAYLRSTDEMGAVSIDGWENVANFHMNRAEENRSQRDEALSQLDAANALLRGACNDMGEAAIWFRDYERQHLAKGTPEGNDKAETNCLRAEFLEKASAKISTYLKDGR